MKKCVCVCKRVYVRMCVFKRVYECESEWDPRARRGQSGDAAFRNLGAEAVFLFPDYSWKVGDWNLDVKKGESVDRSVVSDTLRPHGLYSPPGSSVHRILQARTLVWVAIPDPGWNQGPLHYRQIFFLLTEPPTFLKKEPHKKWVSPLWMASREGAGTTLTNYSCQPGTAGPPASRLLLGSEPIPWQWVQV